jgi:ATP-binding cassette, subfamily B, multidrug efflux pump
MSDQFHEEEKLGKLYDHHLMRRLLTYLRPYKKRLIAALVLLLTGSAFSVAGPFIVKESIDRFIGTGDFQGLLWMSVLYLGVLLCTFVSRYTETRLTQLTGQFAMYDLRTALFRHLQSLAVRFFDKNPVGRLMTRLTGDIDTLNEMFTSGVVTIFGDLFILFGVIGMLLYLNVSLALVTLCVVPLLFVTGFIFKRKVRDSYRQVRLRLARINTFLQENITGMRIVQVFNRQTRNFKQFDELNMRYRDAFLRTIFYYAVFYPVVEVFSAMATAAILWYGGSQILSGALTFGELVAFIMYAQMFYRPIQDLSEKYNILQGAMASSERIFKLLDEDDVVTTSPDAVTLPRAEGRIEFEGVWFAYKDEDWVLKDVSFTVEPGQSLALVGATGAGKTTIINLLSRFYENQKGIIRLDGIDIRDIKVEDLRRNLGVVLQDVFLFSGDIRENIRLWNDAITPEQVEWAAREVNASRFIENLTEQYDAPVQERGATLSTGQKQLLSFARALVYNPQVLILDEATSNIDTDTERLIQEAVQRLMQDRTSIIVAHRLSTIQHVDKILVMHKGRVREEGDHQELLRRRGLYFRLYQLQYKDQELATQQDSVT